MDNIKPFEVTKKNPVYVVIHILGGDNNLNKYLEIDIDEMINGMSENMSVLCLVDYPDKDVEVLELTRKGKKKLESLGRINVSDPVALATFLSRALATYMAGANIAIGFWSHGSGIHDEDKYQKKETIFNSIKCSKILSHKTLEDAKQRLVTASCDNCYVIYSSSYNDATTTVELQELLNSSLNKKINMIFFDSCLNGMAEVMHELAEYAEVIVASTDLEPGDGWDYKRWFDKMAAEPPVDSASWAKQAVDAFGEAYATKTEFHPCTLGAFATDNFLAQAFKALIEAVDVHGTTGWHWMNDARGRTQSFNAYATYDLFHFTQNLLIVLEKYGVNSEAVKGKAQTLADAFQKCRVHSVALGEKVRNSHGLGFWFPYEKAIFMKDVESYSGLSFDIETGWTNYLKKHYSVE